MSPPNQHFAKEHETALPPELQVTALQPPPSSMQSSTKATASGHDLPAQIEQLRNDIFGIAMNVSALNDRLDRLEQRIPSAGQSMQASIATLRGEIETWLESHLSAAVEHCMHQIISRQNSAISPSAN
jgi:outer membrane murein-binding lipoprotein Lpp